MVRRHHGTRRIAAAGDVHGKRRCDLASIARVRAARNLLLCRRSDGRAAAGVLERRAMTRPGASPLAVQRGILGAVLLIVCWEGLARGLHLPAYVLPAVSEILAAIWSKRALLG